MGRIKEDGREGMRGSRKEKKEKKTEEKQANRRHERQTDKLTEKASASRHTINRHATFATTLMKMQTYINIHSKTYPSVI